MADLFFSIGEPGRAACEVADGVPGPRSGPADIEFSAAVWPGMLIRAASNRGVLHRARGMPRQDAFALGHCSVDRAGTVIAVVCDGVGEFGRSDEAAILVSRRLVDLAVAGMSWPQAFINVNEELRSTAEEALAGTTDDPASEGMATTAMAVTVRREADDWAGVAAWVGDSALWHLSPSAGWTPLTGSLHDKIDADYHSASVTPLPSASGACSSREFQISGGAIFVMSDGVANPLKWSRDVQDTLADWWTRPPNPFIFAAQVGFARKSHVDDRTVIGIWSDESDNDEDQES
jgi:hypothetical protein